MLGAVVQNSRQLFPKRPIPLQMPLAAHGRAPVDAGLAMQQDPGASAREAGAGAGVMLGKTAGDVVGPADVCQPPRARDGAENIDEAVHAAS